MRSRERILLLAVLLLAWGLRWLLLTEVPPGWRDDDLIELTTFSQEILRSGPVWYFAGASGHEPLFHTLRAIIMAGAGLNLASARWMAAAAGTLAVLLTWTMGRRLFTREVGLLAAGLVAVSFWSLMYSRVAIRHIGVLPWTLLALYWAWRLSQDPQPPKRGWIGVALGCAGALTTYYAGRLVPMLVLVALPVLGSERRRWSTIALAVAMGAALAIPMFWTAAHLPGADARVGELAVPIRELQRGNLMPLLQTTWSTLTMFHAQGDPEWLYNIAERPVFGILGAALFCLGVLTRLGHLRQPNARFCLLWLAAGLAPAFISYPASSYGHTILALPVTYLFLAMPMKAAARRWRWTLVPLAGLTLTVVAARDLPDYFARWPQEPMVRFLYRGDYRSLAGFLDGQDRVTDATVGSFLYGPWDRVAVELDTQQSTAQLRWVNPERALAAPGGNTATPLFIQDETQIPVPLQELLSSQPRIAAPSGMQGYELSLPAPPSTAQSTDREGIRLSDQPFAGALALSAAAWLVEPAPGSEGLLWTWWNVTAPLPLPEEVLIPSPPPPGVYAGPRLKVFVHLLAQDGALISGDDGLWVDPYTLEVGDRVFQLHRLSVPAGSTPGPYRLAIGLYDPLTGERWLTPSGAGMLLMD